MSPASTPPTIVIEGLPAPGARTAAEPLAAAGGDGGAPAPTAVVRVTNLKGVELPLARAHRVKSPRLVADGTESGQPSLVTLMAAGVAQTVATGVPAVVAPPLVFP
jgi:hypothetical protein